MTNFFGYGSLVNIATHSYQNTHPAKVTGWRRCWVPSNQREVSFLSVEPAPNSQIFGLIADVAPIGWEALDIRETGYTRARLSDHEITKSANQSIQMYRADPDFIAPNIAGKPILLSYLDCVIQGFLTEFGQSGVENFFQTTVGWEVKIRDDRQNPIYPRAQTLTTAQSGIVDEHIKAIGVEII